MECSQCSLPSHPQCSRNCLVCLEPGGLGPVRTGQLCSQALSAYPACFFSCIILTCFLGCFLGAHRVPKGSPKSSKIGEKEVSKRYLQKGLQITSKIMISRTPGCGSSVVNNSKINAFMFSCWVPFGSLFGGVLGAQMEAKSMNMWSQKVIQKHV